MAYEARVYENRASKTSAGMKGQFLMSKKSLVILLNIAGFATIGIIGACIGIGLTQSNYKSYNFTCDQDTDCVNPFICQNGICNCKTYAYYDGKICSKF